MIRPGEYYTLTVVKSVDFGLYLGYEEEEILLPSKYVPEGTKEGDSLKVFVYTDSEDRPVATTLTPKGVVGDFVLLEAVDVTPIGAFMDIGLEKDLLIPKKEQRIRINVGERHVVRILLDKMTNRIIGSTRVENFLKKGGAFLKKSQRVQLQVFGLSELGASVIVNGEFQGMVFQSDIYQPIAIGDTMPGFVKNVRPDGKLDLSLKALGKGAVSDDTTAVMAQLKDAGGFLPFTYKSDAEAITARFNMSKKAFKSALTRLIDDGMLTLEDNGIRLKG